MLTIEVVDLGKEACNKALELGADAVVVRIQDKLLEYVVFDNGILRNVGRSKVVGLGVKVFLKGGVGYSYTSVISREGVNIVVKHALTIAKALSKYSKHVDLDVIGPYKDVFRVNVGVDPLGIDIDEKIGLIRDLNLSSLRREGIASAVTRYGYERDRKVVITSEGTEIFLDTSLVGVSHMAVARYGDAVERVYDQRSFIGGYEFIKSYNWLNFVEEVDSLAIGASMAKTPSPGTYVAVVDNELVGLLIHELLGHAVEGDTVVNNASVLHGRIGEKLGSELINVVDDGLVEGGYPVPYDDEGVKKSRTPIIVEGILKNYLSSRKVSKALGNIPTGNARAQDVMHDVLVRQTNFYLVPQDVKVDELFEGISYGIYLKGKGAMGGEVNPATGTFTFNVGPSYVIRDGEPKELVRGVIISGDILQVLRNVEFIANDLLVKTSVFGGCGKDGQTVKVGNGGPHIRVRGVLVGGM